MPRQLKIPTCEMGELDLYVIYVTNDVWEPEWLALQGTRLDPLLSRVPKDVWDHALYGYTHPLVKALGLPPWAALRKVPPLHAVCLERHKCPSYAKAECCPTHPQRPRCFDPDGFDTPGAQQLASTLIRLWGEGVYVVLIQEIVNA